MTGIREATAGLSRSDRRVVERDYRVGRSALHAAGGNLRRQAVDALRGAVGVAEDGAGDAGVIRTVRAGATALPDGWRG